ncbi:MAG: TonB-dependent receptor [Candidatus Sabulitectum sp.]|nr:TonB-dependent receptor [Candidatus Sabulitectum sp.]
MKLRLLLLITIISSACVSLAFAESSAGSISGRVLARTTLDPLPGAFVVIDGTSLGEITDAQGLFLIPEVPVGGYTVRVTSVGFYAQMKPDVIVKPERITQVEFNLDYSVLEGGVIHVTPDYFTEDKSEPVSRTELSGEQIRRSPGSAGDVSRVIAALPSIAKVDDQYNGMAVRGGNPMENGVYIDNTEVPNVNHFPRQGTSGGGLGIVNTDLIRDVKFSAGGFSPAFGNRLSSIMEIGIREGNREEFDGQVDLSMSGFGTVLEGPFDEGRGSWLVCTRRSYVDLLRHITDIDALPVYSDFQTKSVYDVNTGHRLSLSGVGAKDFVDYTHEQAYEDGNDNFGITDNWNITCGLGWRWIWAGEGFSNTTLSLNGIHYGGDYFETLTENIQAVQNSTENTVRLRNVNTWQVSRKLSLEFGLESSFSRNRFDNFYAADTNYSGEAIPELLVNRRASSLTGGFFGSGSYSTTPEITLTAGCRIDCGDFSGRTLFSPRGSVCWEPEKGTALSAAVGIYRQSLPSELTSRSEEFACLESPKAFHTIIGFRDLLSNDTKLQLEAYLKTYSAFPFDPEQPGFFIFDGVSSEQDLYSFETLASGGEARSAGVEATLRKQLVNGLYGMISGSFSVSEYRNPGQEWRRRIFDNRWTGTVEGGYRFDEKWELSGRWLFAGGRPYTPLDIEASQEQNRTILDSSQINARRYPCYSSLNLRVDRRFYFQESSLVCYLSVWNVLNRRNVTVTYWNRIENKEDNICQWGLMPIFGLEYEF